MSAIARVLLEYGETVSGSDREATPLALSLQQAGARFYLGQQPENVQGAEVVIRSSAIPDDNPEVKEARRLGIPVLKRNDFIGELISGHSTQNIAVCGTHGKTTTTTMITWILHELGQDPSFILGGISQNLHTNAHAGTGACFVIEADEYDHMFLGLTPSFIVVTNIEHDHPDCYPTPSDYQQAFVDFSNRLRPNGTLLACGEDKGARTLLQMLKSTGKNTLTYALEPIAAEYQARQVHSNSRGGLDFEVWEMLPNEKPTLLTEVSLQVPGIHNVRNALAALVTVYRLGAPAHSAASALASFNGTGRRFEIVGEVNGITLIDDYAHHPTEIRTTIAAAKSRFPSRRLWVVWQPHTFSRTQTLQNEFASAFNEADRVIITDIYAAREAVDPETARALLENIAQAITGAEVSLIPNFTEINKTLLEQLRPEDVLLVLSAGDATQINSYLLTALQRGAK